MLKFAFYLIFRGAYIRGGLYSEGNLCYWLGGLIFGGAYIRGGLYSGFYGMFCRFRKMREKKIYRKCPHDWLRPGTQYWQWPVPKITHWLHMMLAMQLIIYLVNGAPEFVSICKCVIDQWKLHTFMIMPVRHKTLNHSHKSKTSLRNFLFFLSTNVMHICLKNWRRWVVNIYWWHLITSESMVIV